MRHTAPTGDPEARRAAVVGAGGFIGHALSTALRRDGVQTACFTRQAGSLSPQGPAYGLRTADVVFYLASSISPVTAAQHPEWARADRESFATLLRGLAREENPPTVVLTSSGGTVYDAACAPPFSEASPIRPETAYGDAKLALEEELAGYSGTLNGLVLRLANVYGPGQRATAGQGVLAHWVRAIRDGARPQIIGDPATVRDYVWIDDVTELMSRLMDADLVKALEARGEGPQVLNVGSGRATSLAELADVVRHVVERSFTFEVVPSRAVDRRHVWLDVRAARAALGWQARTPLLDGVRRTWQATAAA